MKKVIIAILVAVLVLVLITPAALAKPDKDKPLPATDIELVKKVTLQSKPGHGHGGGGRGRPGRQAATGVLGEQLGTGAKKYAIVIGISDYPGEENDLDYCDDDAKDMVTTLINVYDYNETNIISLIDDESTHSPTLNASFDNIHNAVNDIKGRVAADPSPGQDEVVFFFSGHGASGKAPDGDREKTDEAIVSHDGNPLGNFVCIWDGQLKDWFADFDTSRIIFIFDSCLAGGMTDLEAPGRVINMACSESGLSYESSSWGGGHGQFTYYFVDQGMLGGQAETYDNIPGDEDVTIEEAFDYAKANCRMQKPAISDSFGDDLLL